MNKRKKEPTALTSVNTVDIEHEVVEPNNEKTNGLSVVTVVTLDDQIKQEVAKFNLADAAIAKLKEVYGPLTIAGPDDKDGYKAVKAAWQEVRGYRTGVEKKKKEIKADYIAIGRAIDKEETRLTELLTPLEDELYGKWKAIDDLKEQERLRKEQEENDRLMKRLSELLDLGMRLEDGFYQIGGTISMDVATLRGFTDEQYAKLKDAVEKKAAELKKIADDEAEVKRQAQLKFEQEQQQLRDQQAELKRQQDEMKKQQEDLQRQKDEMAKQKRQTRLDMFAHLGMKAEGYDMVYHNGYNGHAVEINTIINEPDETFPKLVEATAAAIKEKKDEHAKYEEGKRQEQIALENKTKRIASTMKAAGLAYDYNTKSFTFANSFIDLVIPMSEFLTLTDAQITSKGLELGAQVDKAKKDQQDRDEQDRKKAEDERIAGLADDEKLTDYIQKIRAIEPPAMKSKKAKERLTQFKGRLDNLLNEFTS